MADKKQGVQNAKRYYQGPNSLPKWGENDRARFRNSVLKLLENDALIMSAEGNAEMRRLLSDAQKAGLITPEFRSKYDQYHSERYKVLAKSPLVDPQTGKQLSKTVPQPRQYLPETKTYGSPGDKTVPMTGADLVVGGGMYLNATPDAVSKARVELLGKRVSETDTEVERYRKIKEILEPSTLGGKAQIAGAGLSGFAKGVGEGIRTTAAGIPGIGEVIKPPTVDELQRKYLAGDITELQPEDALWEASKAGRVSGYAAAKQALGTTGAVLGSTAAMGAFGLTALSGGAAAPILAPIAIAIGSMGGYDLLNRGQDALMRRAYGEEDYKKVRGILDYAAIQNPGATFAADLLSTFIQGKPVLATGLGGRKAVSLLGSAIRGEKVGLEGTAAALGLIGNEAAAGVQLAKDIKASTDAARTLRLAGSGFGSKFDTMVSGFLQKARVAPSLTPDAVKVFDPTGKALGGRLKEYGNFVQNTPGLKEWWADAIGEQGVNLGMTAARFKRDMDAYRNDPTGQVGPPSMMEYLGELAFGSLFIGNNRFTDAVNRIGMGTVGAVAKVPGISYVAEKAKNQYKKQGDTLAATWLRRNALGTLAGEIPSEAPNLGTRQRLSQMPVQEPDVPITESERVIALRGNKAIAFDTTLGTTRPIDYNQAFGVVDDTAEVEQGNKLAESLGTIRTSPTGNIIERRLGLGGQQGREAIIQEGPVAQSVTGLIQDGNEAYVVIREVPESIGPDGKKRRNQPVISMVRVEDIDQSGNRQVAEEMINQAGLIPATKPLESNDLTEQLYAEQQAITYLNNQLKDKKSDPDKFLNEFPTLVQMDRGVVLRGRIVGSESNGDLRVQLMSGKDVFMRVDPVNVDRRTIPNEYVEPMNLTKLFEETELGAAKMPRWEVVDKSGKTNVQTFNAYSDPSSELHTIGKSSVPIMLTSEQQNIVNQLSGLVAENPSEYTSRANARVFKDVNSTRLYEEGSTIQIQKPDGTIETGVVLDNSNYGPVVYLDSYGGKPVVVQESNVVTGTSKPRPEEIKEDKKTPTAKIAEALGEEPKTRRKKTKEGKSTSGIPKVNKAQVEAIRGVSDAIKTKGGTVPIIRENADGTKVNVVHQLIENVVSGRDITDDELDIIDALKMPKPLAKGSWYRSAHQQIQYLNNPDVRQILVELASSPDIEDAFSELDVDSIDVLSNAGFIDDSGRLDIKGLQNIVDQPIGFIVSGLAQSSNEPLTDNEAKTAADAMSVISMPIRLGGEVLRPTLSAVVDRQSLQDQLATMMRAIRDTANAKPILREFNTNDIVNSLLSNNPERIVSTLSQMSDAEVNADPVGVRPTADSISDPNGDGMRELLAMLATDIDAMSKQQENQSSFDQIGRTMHEAFKRFAARIKSNREERSTLLDAQQILDELMGSVRVLDKDLVKYVHQIWFGAFENHSKVKDAIQSLSAPAEQAAVSPATEQSVETQKPKTLETANIADVISKSLAYFDAKISRAFVFVYDGKDKSAPAYTVPVDIKVDENGDLVFSIYDRNDNPIYQFVAPDRKGYEDSANEYNVNTDAVKFTSQKLVMDLLATPGYGQSALEQGQVENGFDGYVQDLHDATVTDKTVEQLKTDISRQIFKEINANIKSQRVQKPTEPQTPEKPTRRPKEKPVAEEDVVATPSAERPIAEVDVVSTIKRQGKGSDLTDEELNRLAEKIIARLSSANVQNTERLQSIRARLLQLANDRSPEGVQKWLDSLAEMSIEIAKPKQILAPKKLVSKTAEGTVTALDENGKPVVGFRQVRNTYPPITEQQWKDAGFAPEDWAGYKNKFDPDKGGDILSQTEGIRIREQIQRGRVRFGKSWIDISNQSLLEGRIKDDDVIKQLDELNDRRSRAGQVKLTGPEILFAPIRGLVDMESPSPVQALRNTIIRMKGFRRGLEAIYNNIEKNRTTVGLPKEISLDEIGGRPSPEMRKQGMSEKDISNPLASMPTAVTTELARIRTAVADPNNTDARRQFNSLIAPGFTVHGEHIRTIKQVFEELGIPLQLAEGNDKRFLPGYVKQLVFSTLDAEIKRLEKEAVSMNAGFRRIMENARQLQGQENGGRSEKVQIFVRRRKPLTIMSDQTVGKAIADIDRPLAERDIEIDRRAGAIANMFDTLVHAVQSRRIDMLVDAFKKDYFTDTGKTKRTIRRTDEGEMAYTPAIEQDLLPLAERFRSEWSNRTGTNLSFAQVSDLFNNADKEGFEVADRMQIEAVLEQIASEEMRDFYTNRMPVFANFGDVVPKIRGLNGAYLNIYDSRNQTSMRVLAAFGSANFTTFVEELSHAFLEAVPVAVKEELASAMRMQLREPTITNLSIIPMEMQEKFAAGLMSSLASKAFGGSQRSRAATSAFQKILDPIGNVLEGTFTELTQKAMELERLPITRQGVSEKLQEITEVLWQVRYTRVNGGQPLRSVALWKGAPIILHDNRLAESLENKGTKASANTQVRIRLLETNEEIIVLAGDIRAIGGYARGLNTEVMSRISAWVGERRGRLGLGVSTPVSRNERLVIDDKGDVIAVDRNITTIADTSKTTNAVRTYLSDFGFPPQIMNNVSYRDIEQFIPTDVLEEIWNRDTLSAAGKAYASDPISAMESDKTVATIVNAVMSARAKALLESAANSQIRNIRAAAIKTINTPKRFGQVVRLLTEASHYTNRVLNSVSTPIKNIRSGKGAFIVGRNNNKWEILIPTGKGGFAAVSSNGTIVVTLRASVKRQFQGKTGLVDEYAEYNVDLKNGTAKFIGRGFAGETINPDLPPPLDMNAVLKGTRLFINGDVVAIDDVRRDDYNRSLADQLGNLGISTAEFAPRIQSPLFRVVYAALDNMGQTLPQYEWDMASPVRPTNTRIQMLAQEDFLSDDFDSTVNLGNVPDYQEVNVEVSEKHAVVNGVPASPVVTGERVYVSFMGDDFIGRKDEAIQSIYESAMDDNANGDTTLANRKLGYIRAKATAVIQDSFDDIDGEVSVSSVDSAMFGETQLRLQGSISVPKATLSEVIARASRIGDELGQPNVFVTSDGRGARFGVSKDGSVVVPNVTVTLQQPIGNERLIDLFNKHPELGTGGQVSSTGKTLTIFFVPETNNQINDINGMVGSWSTKASNAVKQYFGSDATVATGRTKLWNLGTSNNNGRGVFKEYGEVRGLLSGDPEAEQSVFGTQHGERQLGRLTDQLKAVLELIGGRTYNLPPEFRLNKFGLNPQQTLNLANQYDQLQPGDANDLKMVRSAYEELAAALKKQVTALGLAIDLVQPGKRKGSVVNRYGGNPLMAVADVANNRTIQIQRWSAPKSEDGKTLVKYDILSMESGLTTNPDSQGRKHKLTYGDLLVALQNAFHSAANASTFGDGSHEMAYIAHASMTTEPLAIWALAMETRIPNTWAFNGKVVNRDGVGRTDAPQTQTFVAKDVLASLDSILTGIPIVDDRIRTWASKNTYRGTNQTEPKSTKPGHAVPSAVGNSPINNPRTKPLVIEDPNAAADEAIIDIANATVTVKPGEGVPPPPDSPSLPTEEGGEEEGPKTATRRPIKRKQINVTKTERAVGIVNTILRQGATGDASPILLQNWGMANLITNPEMIGKQIRLAAQILLNPNIGIQKSDGTFINRRGMLGRRLSIEVSNKEIRDMPHYDVMEEAGMFLGAYKVDEAFADLKEKRDQERAEGKDVPEPTLMDVDELGYDTDIRDDSGYLRHWPGQGQSERFYTLSRDMVKMNMASNFVQHLIDLGYNPTPLYEKDDNGNYILDKNGNAIPTRTQYAQALRDLASLMNVMSGDVRISIDDNVDEKIMRMAKFLMYSPRWATSRLLLTSMGRGIAKGTFEMFGGDRGSQFIQNVLEANGMSERQLKNRDSRVSALHARLLWKSWLLWLGLIGAIYGTNTLYPHTLGVSVDKDGTRLKIGEYAFRVPGAMMMHLELMAAISGSIGEWEKRTGAEGEESFASIVWNKINGIFISRASPIARLGAEVLTGRDFFGSPAFVKDDAAQIFWEQGIVPALEGIGVKPSKINPLADALGAPFVKNVMWWWARDAMETFKKQRQLSVDRSDAMAHSMMLGLYSAIGGRVSYMPKELKWEMDANKNMEFKGSALDYILGGEAVPAPANLYDPTGVNLENIPMDYRIGAPTGDLETDTGMDIEEAVPVGDGLY